MFGMLFFIVGILWYVGVIDNFSGIQRWTEDAVKTGYYKTQELSGEIEKTVDKKAGWKRKPDEYNHRYKQFLYWTCIWIARRNNED